MNYKCSFDADEIKQDKLFHGTDAEAWNKVRPARTGGRASTAQSHLSSFADVSEIIKTSNQKIPYVQYTVIGESWPMKMGVWSMSPCIAAKRSVLFADFILFGVIQAMQDQDSEPK